MQYTANFKHIDSDFDFDRLDEGNWSAVYADEDEFILALNRMAIASSLHAVVDFPEVEVLARNIRVSVRAINGQLFYTDLHSPNRKDLQVVPIEILRLIEGKPLEEVFLDEVLPEEVYVPPIQSHRRGSAWFVKLTALLLMFAILGFCGNYIWKDATHISRLHSAPQFLPSLSGESEILRQYADVYVSEYREGAMLFELTRKGQFTRYEMWFSGDRNGFVLIPVDVHTVQVGLHEGKAAMLAGEIHLLTPDDDDAILLHGIRFIRHHGDLDSIGEVLDGSGQ